LQNRFLKQKEDEVIAKKERSKRDGTYKSGQTVLQDGEEDQQPSKKKARKELICCSCGKSGHATTRSKACINHVARGATTVPKEPSGGYVLTDADQEEDVANFDTFGLEEENADHDDALLGLLAMTTAAEDPRMNDADGEDLYGTTGTTPSGPI
jgi:hypothetical protein